MDRQQLRAIQDPLKQRYRDEAAAALVTLRAEGTLGEGITCSVQTGRALAEAGLHPATGGDGSSLCSGDMLLEALAACAGVTLRAVATSLDIPVAGGIVHVEGDLDFRGTLALSKDAPIGFRAIRLRFTLQTAATSEQLETLIRLTERYCVVYQTLAGGPVLTSSWVTAQSGRRWVAQVEGPRDQEALRALDTADHLAPLRLRNDPLARGLVITLGRRAPRHVWELDSLRNRFAIGKS